MLQEDNCHNPNDNTTQPQHNLNIVDGLDMKITVQTPPSHHTNSTVALRSLRLTFIDHN